MTDPTPRPDDELVAAVLDGEASDDERAQVEADPAARQRLAELRAVRDLVAAPVTVPAAARESAITAALAEFDLTTVHADAGPPPRADAAAAPDELAARRARRGGGRILAAAAAVVVLVIGAGVVLRALNPPADLTSATSSSQSVDLTEVDRVDDGVAAGGSSSDEAPAPAANDRAVTTTTSTNNEAAPSTTLAPPTLAPGAETAAITIATVELGPITSTRDLRDRTLVLVDRQVDQTSSAEPTTVDSTAGARPAAGALVPCASYLEAVDPELDQLQAVATATYEGQPTAVFAFSIDRATSPAANGSVRIYAVDPVSCATRTVLTVR